MQRRLAEVQENTKIRPRTKGCELPLSFAQERIWLHQQLVPESIVYNRPTNIALHGPLRVEVLKRALNDIVARQEALRTTAVLSQTGTARLLVHPETTVEIPLVDLSAEADPNARAKELAKLEASHPFCLQKGPMLRAQLLRLGPEDHLLLLTFHHFCFDAWSQTVLLRELSSRYQAYVSGESSSGQLPAIQSADMATWDRSESRVQALEKGRSYWREKLAAPPSLQLLSLIHI